MKRSLRSRLTVYLLTGIGLLIVAASLGLEIVVAGWLEDRFDHALEARARALVTLTKEETDGAGGGRVELDFADEFMPEYSDPRDLHYFELWLGAETLLERSGRGGSQWALPRRGGVARTPRFADVRLPDGRAGRLVQIDFVPQVEGPPGAGPPGPEELPAAVEMALDPTRLPAGSRGRVASVLVARERGSLDAQIARLRGSLVAFTAVLLAAVAALIALALAIGLRSLGDLVRQVRGVGASTLDRRIDLGTPPAELTPIARQVNELLDRLEAAFARERRLTSDVAHELKTPIAELRSLCEVAAGREGEPATDPEMTRLFFADARQVGLQMEKIVGRLLDLARYEEGGGEVRRSRVDVEEALVAAWQPLAESARGRRIELETSIPPGSVIETGREELVVILSNLLSNAVDHGRPGEPVHCRFARSGGSIELRVSNPVADLIAADLPHLFDRFWRKDESRTDGRHVGLGLAIVRALARRLGLRADAELDPEGRLHVVLTGPG